MIPVYRANQRADHHSAQIKRSCPSRGTFGRPCGQFCGAQISNRPGRLLLRSPRCVDELAGFSVYEMEPRASHAQHAPIAAIARTLREDGSLYVRASGRAPKYDELSPGSPVRADLCLAVCHQGPDTLAGAPIFRRSISPLLTVATKPRLSSQRRPIANCLRSFLAWPTGSLRARRRASAACLLSGEGSVSEG